MENKEILNKIKNKKVVTYYKNFPSKIGLNIKLEARSDRRVRAESKYTNNSNEFIICLADNWKEADLAHELMHGKIMFLEKYGIVDPINDLCQLTRDYIEDIVVHKNMLAEFDIIPIDEEYLQDRDKWARDLFNGGRISDWYWDGKGLICNQTHKALLYVQAWHFHSFLEENLILNRFLTAFRKAYRSNKELWLADNIIEVYKKNNNLNDNLNYDNALREILEINDLALPTEIPIRHYRKNKNGGFFLV